MQILSMLGFENFTLKINTIGDGDSRAKYREALKAYFAPKIDDDVRRLPRAAQTEPDADPRLQSRSRPGRSLKAPPR
jgi:histidyl-tRNA synthetase